MVRRLRALVWAALLTGLASCDAVAQPLGSGDRVSVDVDATQLPPPAPIDGAVPYGGDTSTYDAPPSPTGTPYGYGVAEDGYAPLDVCARCACPQGSFCFGGATGNTTFSGTCDHLDAATGGSLQIGCLPMPEACAAAPSCACLLPWLAPQTSCYLECAGKQPLTAFCPSPAAAAPAQGDP